MLLCDVFFTIDESEVSEVRAAEAASSGRIPYDEIRMDQMQEYAEKGTKYRKDVRLSASTTEFWLMQKLLYHANRPLSHLLRHLEKKPDDKDKTPLSILVCDGKGDSIARDMEATLSDPCWATEEQNCRFIFREQMCRVLCALTQQSLSRAFQPFKTKIGKPHAID